MAEDNWGEERRMGEATREKGVESQREERCQESMRGKVSRVGEGKSVESQREKKC